MASTVLRGRGTSRVLPPLERPTLQMGRSARRSSFADGHPTSLLGPGTGAGQEPHQRHVPGGPEHALTAAGFAAGAARIRSTSSS